MVLDRRRSSFPFQWVTICLVVALGLLVVVAIGVNIFQLSIDFDDDSNTINKGVKRMRRRHDNVDTMKTIEEEQQQQKMQMLRQSIGTAKVHFRTYGDDKFQKAKQRITNEAKQTGWFDSIQAYGRDDIPESFRNQYKEILEMERGGGYWIWKVPILGEMTLWNNTLMNDGDFLVYVDAGCELNPLGYQRFYEYIQMIQQDPSNNRYDMIAFQLDHPEYTYTSEKVFQYYNVSDEDRTSGQLMATVLIVRKGNHSKQWIQQLYNVLQTNPYLFTDIYNDETKQLRQKNKEHLKETFVDHRHDQSILSVTRKQIGCIVLQDETWPIERKEYPIWASRKRQFSTSLIWSLRRKQLGKRVGNHIESYMMFSMWIGIILQLRMVWLRRVSTSRHCHHL